jgi:hypothetical protein
MRIRMENKQEYDRLCKELVEATNGRVGLEEVEKLYYDA